ncbi:MAG: iron-sulfur protein, partial [Actinobacteria bacterium]|nr:iron-sulfur protein [Actinomycetota bacterium]
MSTHASHDSHGAGSAPSGPKRIRPYQLVIGLGVFMALFTVVSGIVPQFTKWHDENDIMREPFGGIPGPLQIAFYTVVPIFIVWSAWALAQRVRNWERGGPDRRRTTTKNIAHRLADFRAGVYMRTLLRDSAAGLMHSMIYFGFLVL